MELTTISVPVAKSDDVSLLLRKRLPTRRGDWNAELQHPVGLQRESSPQSLKQQDLGYDTRYRHFPQ